VIYCSIIASIIFFAHMLSNTMNLEFSTPILARGTIWSQGWGNSKNQHAANYHRKQRQAL